MGPTLPLLEVTVGANECKTQRLTQSRVSIIISNTFIVNSNNTCRFLFPLWINQGETLEKRKTSNLDEKKSIKVLHAIASGSPVLSV